MMFIALESSHKDLFTQLLSPQLMYWSDRFVIYDLRPTLNYWTSQAKRTQETVPLFLASYLKDMLGEDFRAALARHPWQAVLLLSHMRIQRLRGLVEREDRVGSHLYRSISWQTWWECVRRLEGFFEQRKYKLFRPAHFHLRIKQMQQAVERVGAQTPWELSAVGANALYRRYGALLKMVWEWTFPSHENNSSVDEFPWVKKEHTYSEQVSRFLDHPVMDWSYLEAPLRDDLDRLCDLLEKGGFGQQRIVSLEWQLTLTDTSYRRIRICFRHPHSLSREKSAHGTALLQAYYSFQNDMRERQEALIDDHIDPLAMPAIMGWRLAVTERIALPPRHMDLFGDTQDDEANLINLENRLAVSLMHYDLRNDWSAEESFAAFGADGLARQDSEDNEAYHSMHALARRRPLFIYRDKQRLQQDQHSALWRFCERTMAKWWRPLEPHAATVKRPLYEDYYRYIDGKKRALWVCRHASQQWYVHGIFA